MAITLAQSIPAIAAIGNASSLASTAFGSNPTVGNYVVAWAWGWSSDTHTPASIAFTDSAGGNTWTTYHQDIAADLWVAVGWMKVANTGATFKTTITNPGGSGSNSIVQAELSGVLAASPVDGTPTGTTGTTGIPAPGSMAFTTGSVVIAAFSSDQTTYTTFGYATPTNFTRAGFQNDGSGNEVGEAIYWLSGTTPSAPTWKTGTVKWASQQFALLPAVAATPNICHYPGLWSLGNLILAGGLGAVARARELFSMRKGLYAGSSRPYARYGQRSS